LPKTNRDGPAGERPSQSPDSVPEALERAQLHAKRALGEGVAATRALLEAISLGVLGNRAESLEPFADVARMLDQLATALDSDLKLSDAVARTILEALNGEIARWEVRSQTDADARSVLRTFLGLRELLWEKGLRPEDQEPPSAPRPPMREEPVRDEQQKTPAARKRVQRTTIQG
jgi:hypothetical protein